MDYHILREFADSWVLLALVGFFVAAVIWAYRPGSGGSYRDASDVPFRHESRPAAEGEQGK
jgi:cytochrome c oxidase cbb3-type subunit IV